MLKHKFDPTQPLRYVRYGRMSSDKQNPRSPDQQFITIEDTKKRCGYPWQHVRDYRDDAVKGRYVRRRRDLQQMLSDIRNKRIVIDLILVDTFERFGRADEMDQIRRDLPIEDPANVCCDPEPVEARPQAIDWDALELGRSTPLFPILAGGRLAAAGVR